MKIGIDLDGVKADLMPVLNRYYNKRFGTNFSLEDYTCSELEKILGGTKERAMEIVQDFYLDSSFKEIMPVRDSQEGINALSKNNELITITSRPLFIEEETKEWVEKYFKEKIREIVLSGQYGSREEIPKEIICLHKGIEVMVEDYLRNALNCYSVGIRGFLIDWPWNRNGCLNGVERVKNLVEVAEKLNGGVLI